MVDPFESMLPKKRKPAVHQVVDVRVVVLVDVQAAVPADVAAAAAKVDAALAAAKAAAAGETAVGGKTI